MPPTEIAAQDPTQRRRALTPASAPGRARRLVATVRRAASLISVVSVLAGSLVGGRLAHRWVTHTPRFGARDVAVSGLIHTRREHVLAAASITPSTNVLGLDGERAEQAIAALPWVESARVSRRLPSTVAIEVTERTPAALVAAGALYLCAADGTVFKRYAPGDPDDLPLLTGIAREDFERDPDAAREYVRDALALLGDLSASSLAGRVRVDELHRDPTGDLSLGLSDGVYVWLGRGPYRAKLARLSVILGELSHRHLPAAEIHLESDRHPERATVRLRVAAAAE